MAGRIARTAGSTGLAIVAGGIGVAVAAVAYIIGMMLSTKIGWSISLSIYGSAVVAVLAGAGAAWAAWTLASRVFALRPQPTGVALGLGACATLVTGAIHFMLSVNALGFIHTWGTLYVPWVAVQTCAGLAAVMTTWVKATSGNRAGYQRIGPGGRAHG